MKVLLIEDRVHRQSDLMNEELRDVLFSPSINNVCGGEVFMLLKAGFEANDYSVLSDYSVVIAHRSAFDGKVRNGIIEYLSKFI